MTRYRATMATMLAASLAAITPATAQQPAAPAASQPAQRPVVRLGSKPQELYLTKITVSDLAKSLDFYTRVIGLKLATSPDMAVPKPPAPGDPEKDFVEVALNYSGSMAEPLFVLMKRRGVTPPSEFTKTVNIGFKVPEVRATMEKAGQAGYKPTRPFQGNGQPGFLSDPDGYTIELVEAPSFTSR